MRASRRSVSDMTAEWIDGIKETESRTAPISCITQEKSAMKPTGTAAENAAEKIASTVYCAAFWKTRTNPRCLLGTFPQAPLNC